MEDVALPINSRIHHYKVTDPKQVTTDRSIKKTHKYRVIEIRTSHKHGYVTFTGVNFDGSYCDSQVIINS